MAPPLFAAPCVRLPLIRSSVTPADWISQPPQNWLADPAHIRLSQCRSVAPSRFFAEAAMRRRHIQTLWAAVGVFLLWVSFSLGVRTTLAAEQLLFGPWQVTRTGRRPPDPSTGQRRDPRDRRRPVPPPRPERGRGRETPDPQCDGHTQWDCGGRPVGFLHHRPRSSGPRTRLSARCGSDRHASIPEHSPSAFPRVSGELPGLFRLWHDPTAHAPRAGPTHPPRHPGRVRKPYGNAQRGAARPHNHHPR